MSRSNMTLMVDGLAGSTSNTKSTQNDSSDPFHSPFDDEHDDEWWDEEQRSSESKDTSIAPSRMTQWPAVPKLDVPTARNGPKNMRKSVKRYSVHKPTREKSRHRQKKQNAAAGIKVITNFSRHNGPPPLIQQPSLATEPPHNALQPGCFVDLAALQALNNQAPSNTGGFWKSIKGIMPNRSDLPNGQEAMDISESRNMDGQVPTTEPSLVRIGSRRSQGLIPPPLRLQADLSPADRPIFIGMSIPSASLSRHVTSPQTALSENGTVIQSAGPLSPESGLPETPAITVTSTQVPSTWFHPGKSNTLSKQRPRATSSVHSRAITFPAKDLASSGVPPLPRMPPPPPLVLDRQKRKSKKSVRYSTSTLFSEDEDIASARKSRVLSSYTVFEEDESPVIARKGRAVSIFDGNMVLKHTSISTMADQRRSKGWWNYLTSPFLTRSNTLASPKSTTQEHPALPSLAAAAIKAQEGRHPQEWEKSFFSPVTPETSTTINSDAWWDKQNFTNDPASPEEESGTLPFMLAAGEATLLESEIQGMLPEVTASDDSLKRRPAIRDKFSTQNTSNAVGGSSTRAEEIPPLSTSVTRNPYPQPNVQNPSPFSVLPALQTGNNTTRGTVPNNAALTPNLREGAQESPQPPPYSPPRVSHPRYRAVFPPGHQNNLPEPPSPGPMSPGLQQAMSSRGGIALADVPLAPAPHRPLNLGDPILPARQPEMFFAPPPVSEQASKKARKAEAKRRRHEKEEAVAHKVGGLWRGRGCIPKRGCYGRSGAEGRKRRRCWFGLIGGFLAMIILIVVLATTLHHNSTTVNPPTQWLNLTGFPPIFTGISTVAVPDNPVANSGCAFPATVWSCSLPKELQHSESSNQPNQPNFRFLVQWDNSSSANATFANVTGNPNLTTRTTGGNAVSARQFIRSLMHEARQSVSFVPSPAAPTWAEQYFLGNTTDSVLSANKAGEATPFYISFLSATTSISATLLKRDNTTGLFPDVVGILNSDFPPDVNADGTAASANLLPYPVQQPLRLYDRGLDSEHYGFYNYYNRSIFVKSLVPLNESNGGNGEVPDDRNGGSTKSEASWRCTWSETRFLVQMWTRKGHTASLVNSTASTTSSASSTPSANYTANNFIRPGSFPYPITITADRHGGDFLKKKLYCYGLDSREQPITSSAKLWEEQKDFGGTAINPAPGLFATSSNNTNPGQGGYDGGTGGCSCQWTNWQLKG